MHTYRVEFTLGNGATVYETFYATVPIRDFIPYAFSIADGRLIRWIWEVKG